MTATFQKRSVQLSTRWMKCVDYEQVMEIEQLSFTNPWTLDEFKKWICNRYVYGQVVTTDDVNVIGYYVYELLPDRVLVLNIAVHPSCLRRGVGSYMMAELKKKLHARVRTSLVCNVSDRNYEAHAFFRDHGFTATRVIHGLWDDRDIDAYRFEFHGGNTNGRNETAS